MSKTARSKAIFLALNQSVLSFLTSFRFVCLDKISKQITKLAEYPWRHILSRTVKRQSGFTFSIQQLSLKVTFTLSDLRDAYRSTKFACGFTSWFLECYQKFSRFYDDTAAQIMVR